MCLFKSRVKPNRQHVGALHRFLGCDSLAEEFETALQFWNHAHHSNPLRRKQQRAWAQAAESARIATAQCNDPLRASVFFLRAGTQTPEASQVSCTPSAAVHRPMGRSGCSQRT